MSKLWTALYILAWVLLASWAAHAETPVYCQEPVVKAMQKIWSQSGNGLTNYEAAFILSGTPESYVIGFEGRSDTTMQQRIYLWATTFAVFHVHPNKSGQYPSTPKDNFASNGEGDTGMADRRHVDIYVVHRFGLSVYRWQTKETVLLRRNMDWTTTKGCQ